VRLNAGKIAILLLMVAPAARAQLWSGPAAVEVRVQDPKGGPVSGARVQLQLTTIDPKDGPPAVETDAHGQANVGGLAEGAWIVEVSHEGFMTYVAQINVHEGDRPTVIMATQIKVPGAQRTLEVALARGRRSPSPAKPPVVVEAPAPPPQPAPSRPAAPVTPPAPRREPQPQSASPEVPRPDVAQRVRPEPPMAPAPTTAPAVPAPDPMYLRTAKDRTCYECPPGEAALSTEHVVPPGGGAGCGGDIAAQLKAGAAPAGLPDGCNVLRISLPAGTRYTGYRFEVRDRGESLDCLAGQACPQGTGRWPINPVVVRSAEGTTVLAPFESGPAERERRAVLTVYFSAAVSKRR
jgi:carboxypeptidase family protein